MFGNNTLSPELLMALGGGIMSGQNLGQGLGQGFQNASTVMGQQKQNAEVKAVENKTREWLKTQYPGEDFDTMTPDMMKMYATQAFQKRFAPPEKLTDDMREYNKATAQGFKGSFMEYQIKMKEAGRQQVNIDTGEKLPSGFRWKDTNKRELGVEPIPGGPATTIPAELAARVGMAETFQSKIPDILKKVEEGEATGVVDVFRGKTMGTNSVYGDIESGADALRRLLTGAGMNQSEADDYYRRYLPTYYDDAASLKVKLERLSAELEAAKEKAMLGRGGDDPSQATQPKTQDGVVDYKEFFK